MRVLTAGARDVHTDCCTACDCEFGDDAHCSPKLGKYDREYCGVCDYDPFEYYDEDWLDESLEEKEDEDAPVS